MLLKCDPDLDIDSDLVLCGYFTPENYLNENFRYVFLIQSTCQFTPMFVTKIINFLHGNWEKFTTNFYSIEQWVCFSLCVRIICLAVIDSVNFKKILHTFYRNNKLHSHTHTHKIYAKNLCLWQIFRHNSNYNGRQREIKAKTVCNV